MALGCSTNSMLHLPAIAHEIGFDFDIKFANPISEKTPNLCHLAPAGPTYMEDLNEAGGVYAVMKELADAGLLNTDCMTVTGKTVGEFMLYMDPIYSLNQDKLWLYYREAPKNHWTADELLEKIEIDIEEKLEK